MEFLLVTCKDQLRTVIIDGSPQGLTGEVIEVERGHHAVRLKGPPFDFTPPEIPITIEGTTSLTPMEVRFETV